MTQDFPGVDRTFVKDVFKIIDKDHLNPALKSVLALVKDPGEQAGVLLLGAAALIGMAGGCYAHKLGVTPAEATTAIADIVLGVIKEGGAEAIAAKGVGR